MVPMRARWLFFVVAGLVFILSASLPALAQEGGDDSLPIEREVITAQNVDRIVQLTSLSGVSDSVLAWSADGKTLATMAARSGWGVALFDIDDLQAEPQFIATGLVEAVAISPDGSLLATGHGDGTTGTLTLWSTVDGSEISRTAVLRAMIGGIALNRDGDLIAVSDLDNAYVYGIKGSALNLVKTESGMRMAKFAFSPDGNMLAGADGWQLIIWGLHGYQGDIDLQTATFSASNVAFSPDNARLAGVASTGPNSRVAVWDLASGVQILAANWGLDPLAEYTSANADVSFSADGSLVAASNGSREAYIYDAATGERLATLSGDPPGNIRNLAFSPDGTLIAATGSPDGGDECVWLWGVPKQ
jgi:dipeptidyl aminopeptidase/acylaminoacyl peptidase